MFQETVSRTHVNISVNLWSHKKNGPIILVTLMAHHTQTVPSCNSPSQINMQNHMHSDKSKPDHWTENMFGLFLKHVLHGCTSLWTTTVLHWSKCNVQMTQTPILYSRLASDFLGTVSRPRSGCFTLANVFCVFSYYPECKLLFKTSYTYNKMPISHFCGDQLK